MTEIAENLEHVRGQIADAAKRSGRSLDDIELVAISKTHEAEKVRAAFDAGQQLFGESRIQEARVKIPIRPEGAPKDHALVEVEGLRRHARIFLQSRDRPGRTTRAPPVSTSADVQERRGRVELILARISRHAGRVRVSSRFMVR